MKRTDVYDELRYLLGEAISHLQDIPVLAEQLEETQALGERAKEMLVVLKEWHDTKIPALRPMPHPVADWMNVPRPPKPIIIKGDSSWVDETTDPNNLLLDK